MADPDKILGVILAGGLARRMGGGDKALIELGGQTLLARAIGRLLPQVDALVINANDDPMRFDAVSEDLPIIPDLDAARSGPLAGVLAGLQYAQTIGASHVVTIAVDTPFFPTDLVERLKAAASDVPLSCAMTGERTHPVFGLWPVSLAKDLEDAMANGMRKVDRWTAKHGCGHAVFPVAAFDPFFNINTPEDLVAAKGLIV